MSDLIEHSVSAIAAAIGEAARARILYCLLDGHARTSTELSVVAGRSNGKFVSNTPSRLRTARTCYDHMAGEVAVALHDRFTGLGWLVREAPGKVYAVSHDGEAAFAQLGIDLSETRALRRHFASPCVDWSERRPHLGGALRITGGGKRELKTRFGVTA